MAPAGGGKTGGLHLKQKYVSPPAKGNGPLYQAHSGHVCIPWKSPAQKFCFQAPSLAGNGTGCPKVPLAEPFRLLCKPSLEGYKSMVAKIKGKQAPKVHAHSPILGFKCMVAPTSETARQGDPRFFNQTFSWDVQKLLGRVHALSTLAPSLSNCLKKGLEAKQVSPRLETLI